MIHLATKIAIETHFASLAGITKSFSMLGNTALGKHMFMWSTFDKLL